MLEESEALRRILETVTPGPVTWVPLELGLDQILSQDMFGLVDSPPFDNSSMDGYAVRAAEAQSGSSIRVAAEEQAAGADLGLTLREGEAIRIFTGAPIPEGADAVIMQEDVERIDESISIVEGVEVGENIRRRGGDVCAGQKLLSRGDLMTPTRIGLLASQGIAEVPVHARPLVQIVTTGDELVEPGVPLLPGEIYNSNAPMLQTCVTRAGGTGAASHAFDDAKELSDVLSAAFAVSDLVVIAGGVSVGERDYVKEVLNDLGVETGFWRVCLKPGKPFLYGRHPDGTAVFGLPGNPVSAFVTFSVFVRPVIRRLLGFSEKETGLEEVRVAAGEELKNKGDRPHYLRGVLENGVVRLSGTQQSHAIFGLSKANCLVRLDPEQVVGEGESVSCFLF
jgi:molybdopterin molybdotransferase